MTSGSVWNYYRDKIDVDDNTSDGKSFKYKTETEVKTPERPKLPADADDPMKEVQIDQPNQQYEIVMLKSLFHRNMLLVSLDSWFTPDKP